ncbi:hypothetical protein F2Q70_00026749 [Brassica cretica]|uniref:Uncharacterized protein n=1 Tax=Brassica cretica TaxID=69181 RepID=A0A8S9L5K3_BRACR|nr:hypothetical protein F2Q68_00026320 [Brassica cretica]KAF2603480.1 hypothetical protein F2Q70_00026749 [Brassica cretica]
MAIHVLCSRDSIDEHQRSITANLFFFSSTKATTGASLRLLSTTITSLLGDPATGTSLLPRASTGASLRLLTTTITFLLGDPATRTSLLPRASTRASVFPRSTKDPTIACLLPRSTTICGSFLFLDYKDEIHDEEEKLQSFESIVNGEDEDEEEEV